MIFFTLLLFNYLNLGMKERFELKFGNRVGSKLVSSQSKQTKAIGEDLLTHLGLFQSGH
jgi:hypothetical protein